MKHGERPAVANVYKRPRPLYKPHECRHEALHTVYDRDNWQGLFCGDCESWWQMSDLCTALILLEQARLTAPD